MTTLSDDRAIERVPGDGTAPPNVQELITGLFFLTERLFIVGLIPGMTPFGYTGSFDTNVFERKF